MAKEGDSGDGGEGRDPGRREPVRGASLRPSRRLAGGLRHGIGAPATGGPWSEVTTKPYNSDNLNYSDTVNSNSGGGWARQRPHHRAGVGRLTLYMGAADGGVWRSTDGGKNWTPMSDHLASTSVGALAVNPADHSVWLGTGEANTSADSYAGVGVYRSGDHGATWHKVGATRSTAAWSPSSRSTAAATSTRPPARACSVARRARPSRRRGPGAEARHADPVRAFTYHERRGRAPRHARA